MRGDTVVVVSTEKSSEDLAKRFEERPLFCFWVFAFG